MDDLHASALALAERTLAAIDREAQDRSKADRKRVVSDVAGLRDHEPFQGWRSGPLPRDYTACLYCGGDGPDREDDGPEWPCDDARRYLDGITRTAAEYGVAVST